MPGLAGEVIAVPSAKALSAKVPASAATTVEQVSIEQFLEAAGFVGSFLSWTLSVLAREPKTGMARYESVRKRKVEVTLRAPGERETLADGTIVERVGSNVSYRHEDATTTVISSTGFSETTHPLGWRVHRSAEDGTVRIFAAGFASSLLLGFDNDLVGHYVIDGRKYEVALSRTQVEKYILT